MVRRVIAWSRESFQSSKIGRIARTAYIYHNLNAYESVELVSRSESVKLSGTRQLVPETLNSPVDGTLPLHDVPKKHCGLLIWFDPLRYLFLLKFPFRVPFNCP